MYFELSHLAWLTLAVLAGVYAWRGHAAKETALRAVRRYCEAQQVQLLDDSMVVSRRWLGRGRDGRLGWWRRFGFEFTATGDERYRGYADLLGARIAAIQLEPHRVPPSAEPQLRDAAKVVDLQAWRRLH